MLLVRQPDVTKCREGRPRREGRSLDKLGEPLLRYPLPSLEEWLFSRTLPWGFHIALPGHLTRLAWFGFSRSGRTWAFPPPPAKPCYALPWSRPGPGGPVHIPHHPNLILRMLQGRLKHLATASPVLAASFGTYTHRCGRPPAVATTTPGDRHQEGKRDRHQEGKHRRGEGRAYLPFLVSLSDFAFIDSLKR